MYGYWQVKSNNTHPLRYACSEDWLGIARTSNQGQENFVGWACGGSHIVAPTSKYMVPPTFDVQTIIYAELQAKYFKVGRSKGPRRVT